MSLINFWGLAMEEWKPIEGFEGYEVSNVGNVRSYWNNKYGLGAQPRLMRKVTNGVYWCVHLRRNGKYYKRYIHALVLEAFVEKRTEGMVCRHGSKGKLCNEVSNLSYGTKSENERDKRRDGTAPIGEKHPGAKLTAEQVTAIRDRLRVGQSANSLAVSYHVSLRTIYDIQSAKSWRHLL